ncbi:MAG: universal stress protein, partial [Gammaproteobacteria bacterium]|nr:universal stress protein [Gammaproteobacteria bacterium]
MTDGMLLVVLEADADCTHVLQRAALLARRRQLQVTLLVAERNAALERSYLFDLDAQHRAREGFLRGRRKWLEKQANTLRDMDLEVDLEVVWTRHRDTAILEHAQACGARLIMKATHKHSLLTRAILSQEDWRLIRDTPVPLWLVRDMPWDAHVALGVCVDPLHDGGETRDIQLLAEAHAL